MLSYAMRVLLLVAMLVCLFASGMVLMLLPAALMGMAP